jgi:Predicted endonuclease containing a URI domain
MKRPGTADRLSRCGTTDETIQWSVYILQCDDTTLYTGISNNVSKRIAHHQAGNGSRYTRGRLPVRLLYKETCDDKGSALKREYAIKRLTREEKIKLLKGKGPDHA